MNWIDPQHGFRLFDRLDIQIDCNRLAIAAHQNAFQYFVAARVDLLMRHVRRYKNKITGVGFSGELQMLLSPHR